MCIIFLVIGFSGLVGATISHGCFSILGEAMTQRLRVAILTSIFRGSVPVVPGPGVSHFGFGEHSYGSYGH
jgi:hypothetical protein